MAKRIIHTCLRAEAIALARQAAEAECRTLPSLLEHLIVTYVPPILAAHKQRQAALASVQECNPIVTP